ncbi:unnamed protein product [Cuscuta campestris]|uniref:DUF7769 domain-containing protein n=1 Tax=Cuscuta campestris TaxID=132261 RepID=A0A484MKC9_9ASTE|nr:unnamed protein product [Cuscuta campestris]
MMRSIRKLIGTQQDPAPTVPVQNTTLQDHEFEKEIFIDPVGVPDDDLIIDPIDVVPITVADIVVDVSGDAQRPHTVQAKYSTDFFPTQVVDSASDVDSSADPLSPLLDVRVACSTPETHHLNSISGVHARDERRKKVVDAILQKLNNGKLQHGSIKAVAAQFNMSHRWVEELWRIAKRQLARGQAVNVQCRWQEFVSAAKEGDWDIQLQFQPPNSPDLNVIDLGFFRAIDAIHDKTAPRTMGDLIGNVARAFDQLTPQKLNHVFLTYQLVMGEVLSIKEVMTSKYLILGKKS